MGLCVDISAPEQAAWKKAKNVLIEIAAGLYSDPPDIDFYCQRLDRGGSPVCDADGTPLLDCSRGTNDTECVHKQIITTFGSWCTGVRMSDALLREFRHRYNQRVSERRRPGFPKLGHYDTWLVDTNQVKPTPTSLLRTRACMAWWLHGGLVSSQ